MMEKRQNVGSWVKALGTAVLVAATAGCADRLDVLSVEDPDVVTPEQTEGPAAVPNKVAGSINTFREMYDDYVLYTGLLTDEYLLAGTFPTRLEIDERQPVPNNGSITADVYTPLHRARRTADDNVLLFTEVKDDPAFESVRPQVLDGLALGRLFAGYTRLFFAETFCQSIVSEPEPFAESSPLLPAERLQGAIEQLQQAIPAAQDAGMASGASNVAAAARVGIARSLMFLGEFQRAAEVASQVPTDFQFDVDFSANTFEESNEVFGQTWAGFSDFDLRWTVGDGTDGSRNFEEWPYLEEWIDQNLIIPDGMHDRQAFGSPGRPVNLQTVYAGPTLAANGREAPIPLATGWEARMYEAEVMLRNGQTQAAEELVNSLLSNPDVNPLVRVEPALLGTEGPAGNLFGEFEPVDFTGNLEEDLTKLARAYSAGLWQQGHRQHVLRRYFRQNGINLYPQGEAIGNSMSLPITRQELVNNPNVEMGCPEGSIPGQG